MARNPESNDRFMEALDFIITFLREHEQKLDKLNSQLASVISEIGNFDELNEKLDRLNRGTAILEKQMENLNATARKLGQPR